MRRGRGALRTASLSVNELPQDMRHPKEMRVRSQDPSARLHRAPARRRANPGEPFPKRDRRDQQMVNLVARTSGPRKPSGAERRSTNDRGYPPALTRNLNARLRDSDPERSGVWK